MKTRIWIVIVLVAGLVLGGAIHDTAQADADSQELTWVGKAASSSGPNGDDGDDDAGSDVEGDPENWLGGQNRPADCDQADDPFDLRHWFQGLLSLLTFGLFR